MTGHTCTQCSRPCGRTIECDTCSNRVHPECLGLHRNAYPASYYTCATCVREAAKIHVINDKISDAAHQLVWMKGMRVQCSSQDTYASGLHRYVKFGQEVCGKSPQQMLPPGDRGVDQPTLELFISWAATK